MIKIDALVCIVPMSYSDLRIRLEDGMHFEAQVIDKFIAKKFLKSQ